MGPGVLFACNLSASEATTMKGRFDEARRRGLAALFLMVLSISACNREKKPTKAAAKSPAPAATAAIFKRQAGGEVAAPLDKDSATVAVKWMGDDNIIALARLLNVRVKAAADYELQQWGSDTTRALAEQMAREHAVIRYTIDSLAEALKMTPMLPALGAEIDSVTRQQLTMLYVPVDGRSTGRMWKEQIASHEYMHRLFDEVRRCRGATGAAHGDGQHQRETQNASSPVAERSRWNTRKPIRSRR
jgi:hypothetical protein